MELQASHPRPSTPVARPAVDVVIPFVGSADALRELIDRLEPIELRDADTIIVVDNRRADAVPVPASGGRVRIVRAPKMRSSYYARNEGARAGGAPWLLFVDADVEWSAELLDAYLEPPPAERTAVLAGPIADAPLAAGAPRDARRALRGAEAHDGGHEHARAPSSARRTRRRRTA